MATKMPPHNLKEIIEGIVALAKNTDITIDVSKCETLDGVKIIRIPSNSKLNMNGHYIHASNNVYLYNAGEVPCCIDFESNQKGMLNGVLLKGLFLLFRGSLYNVLYIIKHIIKVTI